MKITIFRVTFFINVESFIQDDISNFTKYELNCTYTELNKEPSIGYLLFSMYCYNKIIFQKLKNLT